METRILSCFCNAECQAWLQLYIDMQCGGHSLATVIAQAKNDRWLLSALNNLFFQTHHHLFFPHPHPSQKRAVKGEKKKKLKWVFVQRPSNLRRRLGIPHKSPFPDSPHHYPILSLSPSSFTRKRGMCSLQHWTACAGFLPERKPVLLWSQRSEAAIIHTQGKLWYAEDVSIEAVQ